MYLGATAIIKNMSEARISYVSHCCVKRSNEKICKGKGFILACSLSACISTWQGRCSTMVTGEGGQGVALCLQCGIRK